MITAQWIEFDKQRFIEHGSSGDYEATIRIIIPKVDAQKEPHHGALRNQLQYALLKLLGEP